MTPEEKEHNLEQLVSQLSQLGFHKTGMYDYLEGCWGMDVIPHYQRERIGDDEMSYQLRIKKDDTTGSYHPEGYQAVLLKTHPVPHGTFGGIDTLQLEQHLKGVNWNAYSKKALEDPKILGIVTDVIDLAAWQHSRDAKDISARLQLRYWLHTPVEQEFNIAQHIHAYEKRAYFPLNNGLSDIHAREAYNLLSDRAVLKFYQLKDDPNTFFSHWKAFTNGELKTYPAYDLMKVLKSLSIEEINHDRTGPQLIYDLVRGERVRAVLNKDDVALRSVYLEAEPRRQTMNLYDSNLQPLNIREHLPATGKDIDEFKKPTTPKITPPKRKPGKNKGRSI